MLRAYVTDPDTDTETEYSAKLRSDKPLEVGAKVANGEADLGDVLLDDVALTLDWEVEFAAGRKIRLTEDASGAEKTLLVGRIASKEFARGADLLARELTLSLKDANADLTGIPVHNWVRPAETGRARALALLTAYLNGAASTALNPNGDPYGRDSAIIAATYVQNAGNVSMAAETYDSTDPLSVLRACAEWENKRLGVYTLDDGSLALYLAPKAETAQLNCSFGVSDNLADVDGVTYFEPHWDAGPALHTDADELLSGALLLHPDGTTYDRRTAIEDVHDRWEEVVYSSQPAASGSSELAGLLNARELEQPRRQFVIQVPAEMVHLVKAGMRIEVKRALASAVATSTYFRIVNARYAYRSPGVGDFYNVIVTLEIPVKLGATWPRSRPNPHEGTRFLAGVAEGGGACLMHNSDWSWAYYLYSPPPGYVDVNGSTTPGNLTGGTITVENTGDGAVLLNHIIALTRTDNIGTFSGTIAFPALDPADPGGFADCGLSIPSGFGIQLQITRDGPGDTTTITITGVGYISGATSADLGILSTEPATLRFRFRLDSNIARGKVWSVEQVEPDWQVTGTIGTGGGGYPVIDPNFDPSASGVVVSYNLAGATVIDTIVSGVRWCAGPDAPIAISGAMYGPRLVAIADGAATVWTLPYPTAYQPGTLDIRVDGIPQTTIEDDPATGDFSLPWTPGSGDEISAVWRVPV